MRVYNVAVFPVLVLFVAQTLQAQPLINDCNNHKLQAQTLIYQVEQLTNAVKSLLEQNKILISKGSSGDDLTNQIYAQGLIRKIPGCIHDKNGPGIQIKTGDILNPENSQGFTVILRSLSYAHCTAIKNIAGNDRRVTTRPEIPGKAPGAFDSCINNPFVSILTLGKPLSAPNTAYIFQKTNAAAQTCQVNEPAATENYCNKVINNSANAAERNSCNTRIKQIESAVNEIYNLYNNKQLAALPVEKRRELLRGLLASVKLPPSPDQIHVHRQRAANLIYMSAPEKNIDAKYWAHETGKYDRLVQAVRQTACNNGWSSYFTDLTSWVTRSREQKQNIIRQIYQAFNSVIAIKLNGDGIVFEKVPLATTLFGDKNFSEAGFEPASDIIIFTDASYHSQPPAPVTFKYTLRVVLEELMHAHQRELWEEQYFNGKLPVASQACIQAPLFMYNAILYRQGVAKDDAAYTGQPLEGHAKKFADYMVGQLINKTVQCN